MIIPTLEQVVKLAEKANVIPICESILADTETPVSVWYKLFRKRSHNFLLESVTGGDRVGRYSFCGADPFITFSATGKTWTIAGAQKETATGNPFNRLRTLMAGFKPALIEGLPRFHGGAVGYMAYDAVRLIEELPDRNPKDDPCEDMFFGLYKTIVAFDNREHRILLITNIFTSETSNIEKAYRYARIQLDHLKKLLSRPLLTPQLRVGKIGEIQSNFRRSEYEAAVVKSKEYIQAGDIFQVVLSQRFTVKVDARPFDLYRALRAINPSPYMFYLSVDDTQIIGASPEMLVRVENGKVEVRPIAGTRPRQKTDEEDSLVAEELLADAKERAEHVMLVDLGRNDVGRVSTYGTVKVEDFMHIEKYSHVMHIVSSVKGELDKSKDAFDALAACFPAGTLSGAPKIRAMEIIDESEPVRRGIYGGALGYIDFSGNLDTCIVIRTMVYNNKTVTIQAGAGLVADSVPATEYDETVNKAKALFTALRSAGSSTQR